MDYWSLIMHFYSCWVVCWDLLHIFCIFMVWNYSLMSNLFWRISLDYNIIYTNISPQNFQGYKHPHQFTSISHNLHYWIIFCLVFLAFTLLGNKKKWVMSTFLSKISNYTSIPIKLSSLNEIYIFWVLKVVQGLSKINGRAFLECCNFISLNIYFHNNGCFIKHVVRMLGDIFRIKDSGMFSYKYYWHKLKTQIKKVFEIWSRWKMASCFEAS